MDKKLKILFYYSDYGANIQRQLENKWGGVGYYRIIKPSQMVKGHDVTVWGKELTKKGETPEERWYRIFKEFDVFWTPYFSDPKEAAALFYTRDKMKKKVVIDCDDNFLDVHPSHPLYDKLKPGKRDKAFMSTILSFADAITVSTETLKQRFQQHFKEVYGITDKKIFVIPNMNDIKDWQNPIANKDHNKFIIGYAGSNSHQDDLKMFFPALLEIMKKYKHVYFESIGSISKDMLTLFQDFPSPIMNRCDLLPSTWTFDEYPKMMQEQKWNVGVAPLVDTAFTRCKTHNKWVEYSMCKMPTIASRVYPYFMAVQGKKTIEHGKTGLLVKPSEWFDALESLILNENKCKELAENAYNHIFKNWQYDEEFTEKLENVLKSI